MTADSRPAVDKIVPLLKRSNRLSVEPVFRCLDNPLYVL